MTKQLVVLSPVALLPPATTPSSDPTTTTATQHQRLTHLRSASVPLLYPWDLKCLPENVRKIPLVLLMFWFCYKPPANYKVLANGSTRWPTDRGSWPTGQSIGQWVGLGDNPLANGLTCWPTDQFSRPFTKNKNFLDIIFVMNHIYVTAAILPITK